MTAPESTPEPTRPADAARLRLAKLRLEDGVSLDDVFRRVTETSADVLGVGRVGVWLFADEGATLRCADLYERDGASHSAGTPFRVDEFPEYFAALGRRKTLPAEDALTDPRTSRLADAYLVPLGITSMLDAPILVGGEVVGVLCHEHSGPPREWTTEQRDFAGSMADLLALKIRAAETLELKRALRDQVAALENSPQARQLAETAAGVAHDFNNILVVLLGLADLIRSTPGCPDEVTDAAGQVTALGERGVGLARMLMDFARPGPNASRVVRPADILAAQLPALASMAGPRHPVALDVRSAAGRALIDPTHLERVVANLVVNARDAMPDGGDIRVAVDAVTETGPDGSAGPYILVEVADSGTGIPEAVLPRIFEPFFTTKPRGRGTGVGLASVRQVVAHAGGFVTVETAVGRGSVFRVYLPRVSNR